MLEHIRGSVLAYLVFKEGFLEEVALHSVTS